ncbi:MAG: family 20 glycosylhydrolase [Spirochaetales bacterium]
MDDLPPAALSPAPFLIPRPRVLFAGPGGVELIAPASTSPGRRAATLASADVALALLKDASATLAGWNLTLRRLTLAAVTTECGFGPPAGFDPREGYLLVTQGRSVLLGADTDQGRRHGLRTLAQVLCGASEPTGAKLLPPLKIADWPLLAERGFHLCYHMVHDQLPGVAPSYEAALEALALFGSLKMNAVLFEPENFFPWKDERLRAPSAFTAAQIEGLKQACAVQGMELIPLVQSIGHAYHVLRHREYAHLRELPATSQQYCLSKPAVVEFYGRLAGEVIDALAPTRFHIGGDESRRLGECPDCARTAATDGIGALYARHCNAIAAQLKQRGVTAMVWGDILEDHPDIHDQLDKAIEVIYWNYDPVDWNRTYVLESYRGRGRKVHAATAARFSLHGDATFPYKRAMRANAVLSAEAVRNGFDGLFVTDWTKTAPAEPGHIAIAFGAEGAWSGTGEQSDFARRFSQVVWGFDFALDRALDLVSELTLKKKEAMNPHLAPPFVDSSVHYLPDWLDRYDWSALNFTQLLAGYAQQENVGKAQRQLELGRARAVEALALFDAALPSVRTNIRSFGVVRLGAVVQLLKCRLGKGLLDAVALLKFPLPDDGDQRRSVARHLRAVVTEWDAARALTQQLLAPGVPGPVLERALGFKFDPQARATLVEFAQLLEGDKALRGLYNRETW